MLICWMMQKYFVDKYYSKIFTDKPQYATCLIKTEPLIMNLQPSQKRATNFQFSQKRANNYISSAYAEECH
jgi:hypothetical protein